MEATIEVREFEIDDYRTESYKSLFGWKQRTIDLGKKKQYAVDLTLMPSEEEKAIILKYKLNELAMEEMPAFSEELLAAFERADQEALKANYSERGERLFAEQLAELRAKKEQILLERYFDNPYTRSFSIRQDAHTYADKLEKEILPNIKNQIDYYRLDAVRGDKRTITL